MTLPPIEEHRDDHRYRVSDVCHPNGTVASTMDPELGVAMIYEVLRLRGVDWVQDIMGESE